MPYATTIVDYATAACAVITAVSAAVVLVLKEVHKERASERRVRRSDVMKGSSDG